MSEYIGIFLAVLFGIVLGLSVVNMGYVLITGEEVCEDTEVISVIECGANNHISTGAFRCSARLRNGRSKDFRFMPKIGPK